MLIELRIRNYAVIERLAVPLRPGLNVLTGETGAGKSIIVGALSLLLGERAASDSVREGAERATIEGVFDVEDRGDVLELLEEQGLETEDGLLILKRQVAAEGRNRAWVNGSPSTAGFLGELGRRLVDLHGQHEHQTLIRADDQRRILDAFGGALEQADEVRTRFGRLIDLRQERERLERRRRETEQRADFLRFQLEEIEKARLEPGEEERLEEEASRLDHSEELASASSRLHGELYAAEDAVAAKLDELRRALGRLVAVDKSQEDAAELLETAYFNVEELGRRMGEYSAGIEHDPARLEEIRRRQDLLFRLKKKYGPELEDVIRTGREAREELDALETADFEAERLEKAEAAARDALETAAAELTSLRKAAAERLAREVMAILPELGLTDGEFAVALERREEIGSAGAEHVEFRISLNAGFEPKPLARIASGGELSRVMLALKTILARLDRIPSLVFDEIDAGIGGRVGHHVGQKLRGVAELHQVLVITHLAQIACRANHHLLVAKASGDGDMTAVGLTELDADARVHELARMLGGDPESETSLEHARELVGAVAG